MRFGPCIPALLPVIAACNFSQTFELPADGGAAPRDAADAPILADAGVCDRENDPQNCGVCGHTCLGGQCRSGQCQAIVLASGLGDSSGTDLSKVGGLPATGPSAITADAAFAYWVNGTASLMRVPVGGGKPETFATVQYPSRLASTPDSIYALTPGMSFVRIAKADKTMADVAGDSSQMGVADFTLGPSDVFFIAATLDGPRAIYRCALPGCPSDLPSPLFTTNAAATADSIAINGQSLFVSLYLPDGSKAATLQKRDRDTGALIAVIGSHAERYSNLVANDTDVYSSNSRYIIRSPVAPSPDSSVSFDKYVVSGDDIRVGPTFVDDGFIYWQEPWGPRRVLRCSIGGCSEPEVLWVSVAGAKPTDWWGTPGAPDGAIGLAMNDDALFFTTGDGNVMKLAKPPSARQALK